MGHIHNDPVYQLLSIFITLFLYLFIYYFYKLSIDFNGDPPTSKFKNEDK